MPRIPLICLPLLLLFSPVAVLGQTQLSATNRIYNQNELKADLQFLKRKLEKIHPGLYRYTSKPALNIFFDSLYHSIDRPMDEQRFFRLITLLHAKIGDGHTMLLPSEATTDHNNKKGRFLPFTLTYLNGKLHIVENNSADSSIEKGEEIVRINGEGIDTIMSQLLKRQIRDGYNQTYPIWILNHYFAAYYSFAYGLPAQFFLELRNQKGELQKKQITALTKDSIKFIHQSRYPVTTDRGITLEKIKDGTTAILTIKSFDPDLLQSRYKQDYTALIDSVFTVLKRDQTTNLILDLRDNQGGDFEPGRYLLSYLLLNPARYLLNGEESRVIQPKTNHFTGKLFVLINGGSFSNTAIVSACLERDKRAVFIGEETGGNKHIISGDPTEISLPNTHIRGFISTTTFQITNGNNDGHGIIPAYPILPAIGDVLMGKDVLMARALELIAE
ncbi:S41 family peptidase [Chitinophaga ginsengisoli]|uniref:C-terminal processing protease CtpA/Prc n=1 Tax=Chitinophaga ginsengisoli TaxID=363837 RepID=A0A2P8GCN7_9BACT|nr:S41 family peptidase [Chitinophaga ginsengisoli]PSL31726.1 C-terminal processing protease CtpA/Prc [Chitinophaga ginsengisoli]